MSSADFDDLDEDASIRGEYERLGADAFYRLHGEDYRNPHERIIDKLIRRVVKENAPDLSHVLDLAAGSGEVTLALKSLGAAKVDGVDPYTAAAYERRVGTVAEKRSFDDVSAGVLAGRRYSLVVCSFALHLCDESRLPGVATQLALIAPELWVLTPHKRPEIRAAWGWEPLGETLIERVRLRRYRSLLA